MKMIRAMVRPESEADVLEALEQAGFAGLTKWDVLGRGRQKGIQVGAAVYTELPKLCLMLVVADAEVPAAIEAIQRAARTGYPGDGRIFVSEVTAAYTIRTGKADE